MMEIKLEVTQSRSKTKHELRVDWECVFRSKLLFIDHRVGGCQMEPIGVDNKKLDMPVYINLQATK